MKVALDLFPETTRVTLANTLAIGGCDLVDLAARFGTPLYVYDAATVVARAGAYREALRASYPGRAMVCYAAKAYLAPWLLKLLAPEGIGLEVASAGELAVANTASFPRERIYLHGNNKGETEINTAVESGLGRIVVDNLDEIALLGRIAARGAQQQVLLRLATADTKFGLDVASGAAEAGVRAILAQPSLELRGFHFHLGSQMTELKPYREAIERLFAFAAAMRDKTGFAMTEMSPGGGYPVRYTPKDPKVDGVAMARDVASTIAAAAKKHGFEPPDVTIEPGRAIVASAGVAVYRVGSVKRGARTYVAVDGGMADNIRPTAYGAKYIAALASRVEDGGVVNVAIAGKYGEDGDLLIDRVSLPLPRVGDLVAVPVAGAYQLAMSSSYNMATRPAVVVVADADAMLVRARETIDELVARG